MSEAMCDRQNTPLSEAKSFLRFKWRERQCCMKYGKYTGNQIEAVLNMVGGETVIDQLLVGAVELAVSSRVADDVIDLDADPFMPNGWTVEEHRKGGKWKFDPKQIKIHLSQNQMGDKVIKGHKLRKELAKELVMNANLLDWYLAHPKFIPDEWKGKAVFFWGTIYRRSDGDLYVRCLFWGVDGWGWRYSWLSDAWGSNNPTVVSQAST